MDDRTLKGDARGMTVRDRRYCIRYPFAADVELLDMESGTKSEGVTSDISMGGAFICTSRPFASNARLRITLTRRDQRVEALAVVRIVKPRIGMGVEFMDVEAPYHDVLFRWVEQLRKTR
jgi:PilZ domain